MSTQLLSQRLLPYPLRAVSIHFTFAPFAFWWKPTFTKRELNEFAREQGETLWWARWLCFQISYSRLL